MQITDLLDLDGDSHPPDCIYDPGSTFASCLPRWNTAAALCVMSGALQVEVII